MATPKTLCETRGVLRFVHVLILLIFLLLMVESHKKGVGVGNKNVFLIEIDTPEVATGFSTRPPLNLPWWLKDMTSESYRYIARLNGLREVPNAEKLPQRNRWRKTKTQVFGGEIVHPQKLTWNLKLMVSNRDLLF